MNRLSPMIVLVKKIHCATPRQHFSEAAIEAGAQLILQAGGVINPLILRREGIEYYHLVAGELEYYAALRAKELNLAQAESINAYILEEENEVVLQEQVKLFRQSTAIIRVPAENNTMQLLTAFEKSTQQFSANLLQQMQTIMIFELEKFKAEFVRNFVAPVELPTVLHSAPEVIVEKVKEETVVEIVHVAPVALSRKSKTIRKKTTTPAIEPVVAIAQPIATGKLLALPSKIVGKAKSPRKKAVDTVASEPKEAEAPTPTPWLLRLNSLSDKELLLMLSRLKIKTDIINTLSQARPFANIAELTQIKGLGSTTLKKLEQALIV